MEGSSDVLDVMGSVRPGEIVLMEYGRSETPALIFHQIVSWGIERGYTIVVNDVLNSLYIYKQHLKMFGINVDFMDDIYSIKWGGSLQVGKLLRRVSIGSPAVEVIGEYLDSMNGILGRSRKTLMIFVGSEKVLIPYVQSIEDILVILNGMLPHLGDERMISFYLINSDIAEGISSLIPLAFEGIATMVVNCETNSREGSVRFEVMKRLGR